MHFFCHLYDGELRFTYIATSVIHYFVVPYSVSHRSGDNPTRPDDTSAPEGRCVMPTRSLTSVRASDVIDRPRDRARADDVTVTSDE